MRFDNFQNALEGFLHFGRETKLFEPMSILGSLHVEVLETQPATPRIKLEKNLDWYG